MLIHLCFVVVVGSGVSEAWRFRSQKIDIGLKNFLA
jgi:hypothetical protein